MIVVYKKTLLERVYEAVCEAARLHKEIDYIQLSPTEVNELYYFYQAEQRSYSTAPELEVPVKIQDWAKSNNGQCCLYGVRLQWLKE